MKKLLVIIICQLLAGCGGYAIIDPGPVQVKQLSVSPGIPWNKQAMSNLGSSAETWTVDGNFLNQIIFISGVKDGEPILKDVSSKNPNPVFKATMLPNEIMEITDATLRKYLGEGEIVLTSHSLKPAMFAGIPGFEFDFNYKTRSGLAYRGYFVGAVKEDLLYAILYRATDLHYYDKHYSEVQKIIQSASLK